MAKVKIKCDPKKIKFACTNGKLQVRIDKAPFSSDIDVDLSSELIHDITVYITLNNAID